MRPLLRGGLLSGILSALKQEIISRQQPLLVDDRNSRKVFNNATKRSSDLLFFFFLSLGKSAYLPLISKMIRVKIVTLVGSKNTQRLIYGGGHRFTFTTATRTEPRSAVCRRTGAAGEREGGNGSGSGPGSGSGATKICINFDQTQEAYKSKNSLELLRSLVVFKLCSYDFLVDRNKEVM